MKNRKKIIFFLMSAVGGAERMTVTFAKQLDVSKYEVVFYLIDYKTNSGILDFIPKAYRVCHLSNSSFGVNPTSVWQFYKVLKKEKPDIVFSSLISINFRLLLWKPLFRKVCFVVRNNTYLKKTSISFMQKMLMRFTYPRANYIITQTDEMKDELVDLLQLDASKIHVIQNPIDTHTIDDKLNNYMPFMNSQTINYVGIGRFSKGKAFDILVKAFNVVCQKEPNSELYIVGRYDEKSNFYLNLVELIDRLNLKSKIHIEGYSNNPYKYMKNADCFVLASRSEGLPNALIEAQYIGTPAAACTCIPVIERIVDDGNTGYLAKSEDYEGLAQAMLKASKLGRIKSVYQSSSFDKFLELL
ncbi:MAG: glycosyltransferase [Bacteroidaceae bacterium]|nr:glycosyltransferase [Bacteroidaceae bacterium]